LFGGREEVIIHFDKYTNLVSEFSKNNMKVLNLASNKRELNAHAQRSRSIGRQINNGLISKRYNRKIDPDSQKAFEYVCETSTINEKIMKKRANLLSNEQGVKIHNIPVKQPDTTVKNRIEKAQRSVEKQRQIEI
jgi:hypothetical protein